MLICLTRIQTICTADHLIQTAEAQLGHPLAQILGDEGHEVYDMLRIAGEILAQLRILRRDSGGTVIGIADSGVITSYSIHYTKLYEEECAPDAEKGEANPVLPIGDSIRMADFIETAYL